MTKIKQILILLLHIVPSLSYAGFDEWYNNEVAPTIGGSQPLRANPYSGAYMDGYEAGKQQYYRGTPYPSGSYYKPAPYGYGAPKSAPYGYGAPKPAPYGYGYGAPKSAPYGYGYGAPSSEE